jgi:serine/threonine-protein kinase
VSEVVARFEREAVAAARIEHPNVVAASDFGKLEDGSFYLVLEYVDGKSLRELLLEGPLPVARAVAIARQTALALSAAHGADIVHRDLKPDNVMLLPLPDGADHVKVLDFGIARVANPSGKDVTHLTRVGVVMGTVAYMSPEQATGQPVDGRTDLYSLGVMLHEMLSGRQPFDAELPSQVLARQLVEPPPPLPAGTPPALEKLVNDLMAKSPADRPQTAREVLDRLAPLDGSMRPPPVLPTTPRTRLYVGAGVVALVLFVIVLSVTGGESSEQIAAESALPSALPPPSGSVAVASSAPEPFVSAPRVGASSSPGPSATASPPRNVRPAPKSSASRNKQQPPPKEKRRTGPGGIYIPPPSQWFKGLE